MYVVPLPARLEKNKKNSNVSLITSLYKYNKCVLEGFVYTAIFDPSSFMQTFFLLYNLYLIFLHLSHSCDYTVRPRTYLYLSYAHTYVYTYKSTLSLLQLRGGMLIWLTTKGGLFVMDIATTLNYYWTSVGFTLKILISSIVYIYKYIQHTYLFTNKCVNCTYILIG